jgi:hypothetical protein
MKVNFINPNYNEVFIVEKVQKVLKVQCLIQKSED